MTELFIYTSVNYAIIVSDKGRVSVRHSRNADLLWIGPLGQS